MNEFPYATVPKRQESVLKNPIKNNHFIKSSNRPVLPKKLKGNSVHCSFEISFTLTESDTITWSRAIQTIL